MRGIGRGRWQSLGGVSFCDIDGVERGWEEWTKTGATNLCHTGLSIWRERGGSRGFVVEGEGFFFFACASGDAIFVILMKGSMTMTCFLGQELCATAVQCATLTIGVQVSRARTRFCPGDTVKEGELGYVGLGAKREGPWRLYTRGWRLESERPSR